jgi:hypothetical protein
MPALVAGIHQNQKDSCEETDARVKPAHDKY